MSSLLSSSWYRVASLKPRLQSHFEVHRQISAGELNFLLQDHSNGKFYRFNVNAYDILGRMDGVRAVHDIWETSVAHLGDDAATQDETIALLGRLHAIGALKVDVTPDCQELFYRVQQNKKQWWKSLLRSPLSVRIPLLDPHHILSTMLPIVGPLFSRGGLFFWLAAVVWGIFTAAMHWPDLSHGATDRILDPANLLLLMVVYPIMKLFHEFGHAIATRKWGGEVHEMGITFLVFVPVPYVDASAMAVISSRVRRIIVCASGMMVELFLAAVALLVWINVEPGFVRLIAFNVMLVGSLSTLLFNGNPLLRFDAYYILKDLIEIPNLASRSSRYVAYLIQRYLFDLDNVESPATQSRERSWLFFYGVAAFLFRMLMIFIIVTFVAGKFFIAGVLMAIWAFVVMAVMPFIKLLRFMLFSRSLDEKRERALGVSLGMVTLVCGLLFFMPVPSTTKAQGVLWVPDQAQVKVGTDGVVKELLAAPSAQVDAGQPLVALSDPTLKARIKLLEAELHELQVRHRIEYISNQRQATLLKEKIASKQAELTRERERAQNLYVHSNKKGEFVVNNADDLPGVFVRQGERIGFVVDSSSMTVRVAVPQNRIGLIRETLLAVDVKLAESIPDTIPAELSRGVPAAQKQLPSRVLGSNGGGAIPVDPGDKKGLRTLESVFVFDVTLQEAPETWRIGQRAFVKFDHGNQPLAEQWYRLGRQLFIRRFGA